MRDRQDLGGLRRSPTGVRPVDAAVTSERWELENQFTGKNCHWGQRKTSPRRANFKIIFRVADVPGTPLDSGCAQWDLRFNTVSDVLLFMIEMEWIFQGSIVKGIRTSNSLQPQTDTYVGTTPSQKTQR